MRKAFGVIALAFAIGLGAPWSWAQTGGSIVKLDAALDGIISPGAKLEKLRDGYVFLEGPVWSRSGGYLLFSNMPEKKIERWTPDGKISTFLDLSQIWKTTSPEGYLSNGLTFDSQRRLVYCSDRKSTRLNSSHIQKSRMPSSA